MWLVMAVTESHQFGQTLLDITSNDQISAMHEVLHR